LLIFDECHHARKDHPFCCIMKEFYHVLDLDRSQRPKVFGMTASPSSDIGSKLYHTARYDRYHDIGIEQTITIN
jgi:superfamily II DNA or RNA helicase